MKPRQSNSVGAFKSPQFKGKKFDIPFQHDSYFSQTTTTSRALEMLQSQMKKYERSAEKFNIN